MADETTETKTTGDLLEPHKCGIRRGSWQQLVKAGKLKTREDWVNWYCERTGDSFRPNDCEIVVFEPNKGFLSFIIDREDNILFGHYVAGDVKYWLEVAKDTARYLGLPQVRFYSRHDVKVVQRLSKARIRGYLLEIDVSPDEPYKAISPVMAKQAMQDITREIQDAKDSAS